MRLLRGVYTEQSERTRNDKEIKLTVTEGNILYQLMKQAGRTRTHADLAEEIWGDDYPGAADTIKVHIRHLREKLEADPSHPKLIVTRAGIGYLLVIPE
jgi:two-component system KDP operon response regulator KdpE